MGAICFFCGDAADGDVPCGRCAAALKEHVILLSVGSQLDAPGAWMRTGNYWVVSEELVRQCLRPPELVERILQRRYGFISDDAAKHLGLPL